MSKLDVGFWLSVALFICAAWADNLLGMIITFIFINTTILLEKLDEIARGLKL